MNKSRAQVIETFLSEYSKKQFELKEKVKALYKQYPELAEIEQQIDNAGIEYTKEKIKGNANAKEQFDQIIAQLKEQKNNLYKKYGISENRFYPVYNCSHCKDSGFIDGIMCDCLKKRIDKECLSSYDLKLKAQDETFDHFDLSYYSDENQKHYQIILKLCKKFCENFDSGSANLFLYGNPGLGKTFLCNCIVNALGSEKYNIVYITSSHLLKYLSEVSFDHDKSFDTMDVFYECDLLIIDDLGAEYRTEYNIALLFDLINERILSGKSMIVSSNLQPQEIKTSYNSRLYSRICGEFRTIPFKGEDIRFKKKRHQN